MLLHYLWGIETTSPQPLKPLPGFCYYITYEELKHRVGILTPVIPSGYYITYEELKLLRLFQQGPNNIWLLHYLWGIETRFFLLLIIKLPRLLHYLWGIETLYSLRLPCFLGFCYYITYEELKLSSHYRWGTNGSELLHYLWGIETLED